MNDQVTSFRTIPRGSVVQQIIESFKQGLIHGELQPGQRLPSESELAQQLGVGRTALREAMKMLEALGVVRIRRGNGTYIVDKPSPALLDPLVFAIMLEADMGTELLELRSLVQTGYCQLAAEKATPEDWVHIEEAAQAWESYARRSDVDLEHLTRLDLEFHYSILKATHNPLVLKIGRTVEDLFFASIRSTLSKSGGRERAIEGHQRIIEALRTGEPETIRQAVTHSLDHWGPQVGVKL